MTLQQVSSYYDTVLCKDSGLCCIIRLAKWQANHQIPRCWPHSTTCRSPGHGILSRPGLMVIVIYHHIKCLDGDQPNIQYCECFLVPGQGAGATSASRNRSDVIQHGGRNRKLHLHLDGTSKSLSIPLTFYKNSHIYAMPLVVDNRTDAFQFISQNISKPMYTVHTPVWFGWLLLVNFILQGPFLLISQWIIVNPSNDMQSHVLQCVGWNYLSISKIQRLHCCSLAVGK